MNQKEIRIVANEVLFADIDGDEWSIDPGASRYMT